MRETSWPVPVRNILVVTENMPCSKGIKKVHSSVCTADRNLRICEICLRVLVAGTQKAGIMRHLMATSPVTSPASFAGVHSMTLGRWSPVRAQGTLNVAATIRRHDDYLRMDYEEREGSL